jgi:hypothetical protein
MDDSFLRCGVRAPRVISWADPEAVSADRPPSSGARREFHPATSSTSDA